MREQWAWSRDKFIPAKTRWGDGCGASACLGQRGAAPPLCFSRHVGKVKKRIKRPFFFVFPCFRAYTALRAHLYTQSLQGVGGGTPPAFLFGRSTECHLSGRSSIMPFTGRISISVVDGSAGRGPTIETGRGQECLGTFSVPKLKRKIKRPAYPFISKYATYTTEFTHTRAQ